MNIEVKEMKVPSSDGIHQLAGRVYVPDGEICGLFHVVHGMTEHIRRYDDFMRRMAALGFVCFGYDNLGHGYTANDKSELGFIAHKDGWRCLAQDVERFSSAVRAEYGEQLPYVLMGHSMGSFIVRTAAAYFVHPDRLIIMGTGGPNPATGAGLALTSIIKLFCGEKHVSKFIEKITFSSYTSRFDKTEGNSWLTKDPSIREKYASDDFCTFKFTVSAMHDLIKLNSVCNSKKWADDLPKDMPVLMVSGADDPVGDYGNGVKKVYERLLKAGVNVRLRLYENCRHEVLNDTCRDEVIAEITDFVTA